MTIRIVKARQTCFACPSQWDAWDQTGRYLYLRYRYGIGRARRYDLIDDFGNEPGEQVGYFEFDTPWGGCIDLETFCDLAGLELDLGAHYRPMPDPNEGESLENSLAFLEYLIEKTKGQQL
ncbi:hypothetical protein ACFYU5_18920 [Nocardia aobensis]|uniref:Uncharacterized protein n=1 Tax=Nocardia aobensis TaxID=257277 RepID=A0ABW6P5Q6_9NOCA